MAFDDIEKLKEKIAKDPSSKLFVPLSEEYRKAGMFDEAIDVLKKGLGAQPSYMSARVALGKIYLEKAMITEARDEFEQVIKAIPDNLFAHKKLAEIYRDLDDPGRAIGAYESVLKLNPLDEDAKINLESLAGTGDKPPGTVPAGEAPVRDEPPAMEEEPPAAEKEMPLGDRAASDDDDLFVLDEGAQEIELGDPGIGESVNDGLAGEAFEDFKKSMEADARAADETDDTPMFFSGEQDEARRGMEMPEETIELSSLEPSRPEESTEGASVVPSQSGEAFALDAGEPSRPEELTESASVVPSEPEEATEVASVEPILSEEPIELSSLDPSLPEEPVAAAEAPSSPPQAMPSSTDGFYGELKQAEELIGQSQFGRAMQVYTELLKKYPDDKRILQKLEELRNYLKMIGKGGEETVQKMELFLSGIRKRKHDLYGRS